LIIVFKECKPKEAFARKKLAGKMIVLAVRALFHGAGGAF
jgi:hypothetical protein